MTDREMLEYAAKAAGIDGVWQDWDGMDVRYGFSQSIYSKDEGYWNPLDDDGDAFRLAVKLRIEPRQTHEMCSALFSADTPAGFAVCNEMHDGDPCAATRLAITRAAAEIGKRME